jgi:hypothetical protein
MTVRTLTAIRRDIAEAVANLSVWKYTYDNDGGVVSTPQERQAIWNRRLATLERELARREAA